MNMLLLWLEGPLQSWGVDSRYANRTTLPFPTRSGILGLLCCAAGKRGEQREWLARMTDYQQTVRGYARKQKGGMTARLPLLVDYQTAGAGYDKKKGSWQNLLIPKKADGKAAVSVPGTKILYRHYIQDMAFACVVELPDNEAEFLSEAVKHPVWELSLGRRNCPPSDIIGRGLFPSEAEALEAADRLAEEKGRQIVLTVREGSLEDGDEVWTLHDVPRNFGPVKTCQGRQVTLYHHATP